MFTILLYSTDARDAYYVRTLMRLEDELCVLLVFEASCLSNDRFHRGEWLR